MKTRSNCIAWAIRLFVRRRMRGREGYLMIRISRWGPFPHMLYAEVRRTGTIRVVSYKPTDPGHHMIPPPLFRGSSKWGDFPDTETMNRGNEPRTNRVVSWLKSLNLFPRIGR